MILCSVDSPTNQRAITPFCTVAQPISELLHFFALLTSTRETCWNNNWHENINFGKILDLAVFSSQDALSLHFSFRLEVTINAVFYRSLASQTHIYVTASAGNGPAIAGPAGPVPAPMGYLALHITVHLN